MTLLVLYLPVGERLHHCCLQLFRNAHNFQVGYKQQYDNYSDIVLEVNTSKLATTLVQVLKQCQMLPASQH